MPPLVADPNPWHSSAATVCVGPSQQSGRLEWELRSGASSLIDSSTPLDDPSLTQETDQADRTGTPVPPVSFVRKSARSARASERPHNLGTTLPFGASAPVTSPPQNWSPDSLRGSRLSFEWIVSGLTAVCFWTAPRSSVALEGPVRFGFGPDFTLARLSPNRCLAGCPVDPSCLTEN
jgi:hypothetical protein